MKTIYLLRHAKSGWSDTNSDDFNRPLNEQGQQNAVQIGHHIAGQKIHPDLILCSAATRAQETLSYIRPFFPDTQAIQIEEPLYLAASETLLKYLMGLEDGVNSVLIIAHNPGLHELTINLAGRENIGTSQLLNQVMQRFPSGAITTVKNDSNQWMNLNQSESTLIDFVCPSDLPPLANQDNQ